MHLKMWADLFLLAKILENYIAKSVHLFHAIQCFVCHCILVSMFADNLNYQSK